MRAQHREVNDLSEFAELIILELRFNPRQSVLESGILTTTPNGTSTVVSDIKEK